MSLGTSLSLFLNIQETFLMNLPAKAREYLLQLFSRVWLYNEFPRSCSESTIILILKSRCSKTDPEPISSTCAMCILMEKSINRRLLWTFESNKLLILEQNGFRQTDRQQTTSFTQKATFMRLLPFNNTVQPFFFFDITFDTAVPESCRNCENGK